MCENILIRKMMKLKQRILLLIVYIENTYKNLALISIEASIPSRTSNKIKGALKTDSYFLHCMQMIKHILKMKY